VENPLVLRRTATLAKSNEITAIPALLEVLMLKDCIATINPMRRQRKNAQQVIDQGGVKRRRYRTLGDTASLSRATLWVMIVNAKESGFLRDSPLDVPG
jgi:predicted transposase YbfD/YdcC